FTAYLDGRLNVGREQFIDYCVDLLLNRVSSY
ncbi:MAG: TetR/AcrR family transcriptional regulator, partial [Mycolicibacterium hassiacum]|nr:TetR/AcrR family transcriptional regulator [Mycolicibacterium hassiacum]